MKNYLFGVEINNLKHHYSYVICVHTTYEGARKHCDKFNIDFTKDKLEMIAKVREIILIEDKD